MLYNFETVQDWFRDYGDDVYHFLLHYVGKRDAEDLTQETFVKALRKIHTYRAEGTPKVWLLQIARRTAIDYARKHRYDKYTMPQDKLEVVESNDITPEQIAERNHDAHLLKSILNQMSPKYRSVLVLRGLQELSAQETATILGCSPNSVRVTYHRALKVADKMLQSLTGGGNASVRKNNQYAKEQ
ncbi:RNA polymerase sigma factor [Alicyclobacillus cycloheptanicus]|uniref:RNA polymerase sigma-70 factor (ECF subfamily) n=1 Tax=Alicyclobacillus cycloheptanicus TaxID=1457 RepID=A0ABT9XLS6_9BACL|nr:RNA polymerase sigma factor [Alicyclobacillus cycloheptanicus]MDQ0191177.1 RNA polymerase sigma-70 factor (ECF subfamily) [Alicyclobacillus cycloheptanicus]WDM02023.1 RNA polymerase sigma factor [Alicyclobacillus cycloheptanicus]